MSNQNVNLTLYKTRIPERMALCRTTALNLGRREAKCNVGPLPTDWPYKITSSCLIPYSSFKQLYTASMSQYVLNSEGYPNSNLISYSHNEHTNMKEKSFYLTIPYQWTLHTLNNHSCNREIYLGRNMNCLFYASFNLKQR